MAVLPNWSWAVTVMLKARPPWRSPGRSDGEVRGGGGADGDVLLVPVMLLVTGVGGGDGLVAGGHQGDAVGEGVHAVVAGDEGVVGRHRSRCPLSAW